MGNQASKHLRSFRKTEDGKAQTLCDLEEDKVLESGGHCFATREDLEESCTLEERKQRSLPEVICGSCFRLGRLISLRRSLQQGSAALQTPTK
jgi:hypothetical protein